MRLTVNVKEYDGYGKTIFLKGQHNGFTFIEYFSGLYWTFVWYINSKPIQNTNLD